MDKKWPKFQCDSVSVVYRYVVYKYYFELIEFIISNCSYLVYNVPTSFVSYITK